MAVRHGLAGQYGKRHASRRWTQGFVLLVAFMWAWGTGCYAMGYVQSRWGVIAELCLTGLAAVPVWYTWRWAERRLNDLAKDRIKYLRGGQAEALVAWMLERELDENWHIFNGVMLESDSDRDHVVVGPGGVFCVSTKATRGWFVGTPEGVLHNNEPSPIARQADRHARTLKDRLKALLGDDVPWVNAVLVPAFGWTDGDALGGKVLLANADDLARRIAPEDRPRVLDTRQVDRIVKAMTMIAADAAAIYQRPAPTLSRAA